jgi:hypothetical protein
MNAVTTRRAPAKPKPFAWSYSKLKNFETCPKRHWHIDIAKDVSEPESEQLKYGNVVHTVMAQYIQHGTQMPPALEMELRPFADRVFDWKGVDVRSRGATVEVEQQYAITADLGPTEWFGKDAWFRGIGDVVWELGPLCFIGDWKTGKILEDTPQLILMAACIFAHKPHIQMVRSQFIWLKEDAETTYDVKRADMPAHWANLLPRVQQMVEAHRQMNFPAKPSGLCKRWCPVKQCPHNGG